MMCIRTAIVLISATVLACSGSSDPESDAGTDAAAADAAIPIDSGRTDEDGDGVPAALDCDDTDPAVAETSESVCSNECGSGITRCSMGVVGECDAPLDCVCDTVGEMRLAPCERCGMVSERCSDAGRWEAASACVDQGECEAAEVESRATLGCGEEQRVCGSLCAWGDWSTVVADGECEPGWIRTCPDNEWRSQWCDEACEWEATCR